MKLTGSWMKYLDKILMLALNLMLFMMIDMPSALTKSLNASEYSGFYGRSKLS